MLKILNSKPIEARKACEKKKHESGVIFFIDVKSCVHAKRERSSRNC